MPEVKLTYLPVKGLGEQIRMLLAYGGQEFEDIRVTHDEWNELRDTSPFGQMPVLLIDNKQYAQSVAISRYLGRKYGLSGANIEEDFEIDQNAEFLNDIRLHCLEVYFETKELQDMRHKEKLEVYPGLLAKLDEIIRANNGHLAAGKLTWADFVFAGQYEMLKSMMRHPDLDQQYPSFKNLNESVLSHPRVQTYLENSQKTSN